MLYVCTNDGMLRAFDAVSGLETMAFKPRAVFNRLSALGDADNAFPNIVGGPLTVGDAYLGNDTKAEWKTIVLGSTGKAAKSLFALDVSDPESLTGNSALWQRSANDDGLGAPDDDMGYLLGEAFTIRLRNGTWAAVYGNGYKSKNKRAALYLVDLADGRLIAKLVAGPANSDLPNGLATPAFEFNAQRETIAAYAGDLQGHLWKFDLDAIDPRHWKVAFNGQPLFVATDGKGRRQPIVQQPLLDHHPTGGKIIIFHGGKALNAPTNKKRTQTLYGIREKIGTAVIHGREALQQQTLMATSDDDWTLSRNAIDWYRQRGWYIDLPDKAGHAVGKLQIVDGVLWALTYSPLDKKSRLIAVDFAIGGAADGTVLSALPQNKAIIRVAASTATPTFLTFPDGRRGVLINDRQGDLQTIELNTANKRPFRTWRQLPTPQTPADFD